VCTDRAFRNLAAARAELDEWVEQYNTSRPHQALDMAPGAAVLVPGTAEVTVLRPPGTGPERPARSRSVTHQPKADSPHSHVPPGPPGRGLRVRKYLLVIARTARGIMSVNLQAILLPSLRPATACRM
jgi:Integrase core domain